MPSLLLCALQAISPDAPNRGLDSGPGPMAEGKTDSSKAKFEAVERPTISFADVAGLEHVKEEIRLKMIYPFLHPEKAKKYNVRSGGGILLYGPPGTGKTMIAKAIAGELEATFFAIAPSEILNKWVGESEKNIRKLFDTARRSERAIIFLDEVEALTPPRRASESGGVMQRVVPQILNELDKLKICFLEADRSKALHTLKRVSSILKVLVSQVDVLETMTPLEFLSFRERLQSASGFQSCQFRELEFLLGLKHSKHLEYYPKGSQERNRLERRLGEESLWDTFFHFLSTLGLDPEKLRQTREHGDSPVPTEEIQNVLEQIYRNHSDSAIVCEMLTDFDEGLRRFFSWSDQVYTGKI